MNDNTVAHGRRHRMLVLCAGVLAALLAALIVLVRAPDRIAQRRGYAGGPSMFALDTNIWPGRERDLLAAYGDVGRREIIITHLAFDLPFVVAYTAFFVGFLGRSQRPWSRCLPLAAGAADVIEDAGIILMATGFPEEHAGLPGATIAFTLLKDALFAVSAGLTLAEFRKRNWLTNA